MSELPNLANSNVVPLGRGGSFAVDRRAWAKACDLGINVSIASLIITRGTDVGMRTTSWSAKSMQDRTSAWEVDACDAA